MRYRENLAAFREVLEEDFGVLVGDSRDDEGGDFEGSCFVDVGSEILRGNHVLRRNWLGWLSMVLHQLRACNLIYFIIF